MSGSKKICPLSHRGCAECSFYVGRHHYTDFFNRHRDCSANGRRNINFEKIFQELGKNTPNALKDAEELLPPIKLKVINLVTEQISYHDLDEAGDWDWNDSQAQRFINGSLHITSRAQLLDYCRRKIAAGDQEVVIYESPGHLLASGG